MFPNFLIFFLGSISAVPINVVQRAADNDLEKLDNYLPKVGNFPKYHYSTFGGNALDDDDVVNLIEFKSSHKENLRTFGDVVDFVNEGASAGMDIIKDVADFFMSTTKPGTNTTEGIETTTLPNQENSETTTLPNEEITETTTEILETINQPNPIRLDDDVKNTNRTARQEDFDEENNVENNNNNNKEKESQESDEEEEEEENMVTGLIGAFLGGLSRPDGSVDIEAITGLLGSLSTQNPDGTYDFNGLTELLMSFFGGGEEGGGSDFGAFLGGLAGAFLKGVANPPGAKGTGIFLGNLLGGILPGLSAPAPTEEGEKPQPPLDSGGFFGGFLSSILGNLANLSGAGSSSNSGGDNASGGGGNKFSLFKAIFSLITSVFTSSSAAH